MSTSKRPRTSRTAALQRSSSPGEPPASKRLKPSHVPAKSTELDFLVDEDKRKDKSVKAKLTNGVSRPSVTSLDDSHAILASSATSNGVIASKKQQAQEQDKVKEIIELSSGEEDSSELEEDDDELDAQTNTNVQLQPADDDDAPLTNGHVSDSNDEKVQEQAEGGAHDEEMEDVDEAVAEAEEPASFGELLQARHPGPIDVRRSLGDVDPDSLALAPAADDTVIPTGHSLRTALSQALKNNDKDLLEACFSVTNPTSIRVTIQRLKSNDVSVLLERIAERIHKTPGRTGPLMVWVQWALVDHGGYLANQPELMSRLRKLSQVVRERASGLLPLLHLKGKLDLLCAQLQHRRDLQANSKAVNMEDPDDERDVLYVEGQDENWSGDSDDEMNSGDASRKAILAAEPGAGPESDDEDEGDLPNGVSGDVEDDSSADDDDEDEGEPNDMLDIEAESTDDDDAEEGSEEEQSEDDDEEEEESDEESAESEIAVAQPKLKTLNRKR